MRRLTSFFIIAAATVMFTGILITGVQAQEQKSKPKVETGHAGILLQMSPHPPEVDSAAFGVLDSAAAARWEERLDQASFRIKANNTGFDRRAFLKKLLAEAGKLAPEPGSSPVRIRTEARPGNRLAVLVENASSEMLHDLKVTITQLPEDWEVTSESDGLRALPPGQTAIITKQLSTPPNTLSNMPERVGLNLTTGNGLSLGWSARVTLAGETGDGIPEKFSLHANYPNPFNTTTTISYSLPQAMTVHVEIFTILGQKVVALVNAEQQPGVKNVTWDASHMASGTYLYRIVATAPDGEQFVSEQKMVLVK